MTRALYTPGDFERLNNPAAAEMPSWRSPFRRDYARLLHSAAYRRLQGKTQLFAGEESDFFRNRLTHSQEVAQIAGSIALKLNDEFFARRDMKLDVDLVQFAGLAHDLGHPPFGHTGEEELDKLLHASGGFEGNAQTLRLLARIEKKLVNGDSQFSAEGTPRWYVDGQDVGMGLDLCARSLAAVLKYDREIPEVRSDEGVVKGYYQTEAPLVAAVRKRVGAPPPARAQTVECQIMDLADDIAYSTYDIEDAFHAGLLTPLDLIAAPPHVLQAVAIRCAEELQIDFTLKDVEELLTRDVFPELSKPPETDHLTHVRKLHRISNQIASNAFFRGALTSSLVDRAIRAVELEFDENAPAYSQVRMVPGARLVVSAMKHLMYVSLIRSPRMKLVAVRGRTVVRTIYERLASPQGRDLLPNDWVDRYEQAPDRLRPRVIADFISGMTDRQALDYYSRLTSSSFRSMFGLH